MARFFRSRPSLPFCVAFAHAAAAWVALLTVCPIQSASACGTPPPQECVTTTSIIIMSPKVILNDPTGVTVPITFTVFVGGANGVGAGCASRVGTSVTLTPGCSPGPTPGPVGPIGLGPAGGVFTMTVPIFFPPGPPRVCTVTVVASTGYTLPAGTIVTGTGGTQVCIVEPAPGYPSLPRLDLQLLSEPARRAHPGDERSHVYRITNNDATNSVTGTLTAGSNEGGRLSVQTPPPVGGSGSGPGSAASPVTGDAFPIEFGDGSVPPIVPNNYSLDDGTAEDAAGINPIGDVIWLNDFTVALGQEVIDRISVAFGPGTPNGKQVHLALWRDPNNDGNPSDAVLLHRREGVTANAGTGILNDYPITPIQPGPIGSRFFVGAMVQNAAFPPELPAAMDRTTYVARSWFSGSLPCDGDLNTLSSNIIPPTLIGTLLPGLPGNWLIRAHGSPVAAPRACVVRGNPDLNTTINISRTITLCPGESRIVRVNHRSFGMCRSGSCSQQTTVFSGTFADATPSLACAGAGLMVDSTVPADFRCIDGGMMTTVSPIPLPAVRFQGAMPTHPLDQSMRVLSAQIIPQGQPPANTQPALVNSIDNDPNLRNTGRFSIPGQFAGPVNLNQPINISLVIEVNSLNPGVTDTLLPPLDYHPGAPALGDTFFFVGSRSRLTGPGIPPTLDSFFDVFHTVSLDGITSGLHRKARILPGTVTATPLGPTTFNLNFPTHFPPDAIVPPVVAEFRLNIDGVGTSAGLPQTVRCPRALTLQQTIIAETTDTLRIGTAVDGDGPLVYQWRRNTIALTDDARISGSSTPDLRILNAMKPTDAGTYDCVVFNALSPSCGTTIAPGAQVIIFCRADFNRDGMTTVADIFAFLAAWFGGNPLADFNHSGSTNVSDIFAFLIAWFSGC